MVLSALSGVYRCQERLPLCSASVYLPLCFWEFWGVKKLAFSCCSSPAPSCWDPHRTSSFLKTICISKAKQNSPKRESSHAIFTVRFILMPRLWVTRNSSRRSHGITENSCKLREDCSPWSWSHSLRIANTCCKNVFIRPWWMNRFGNYQQHEGADQPLSATEAALSFAWILLYWQKFSKNFTKHPLCMRQNAVLSCLWDLNASEFTRILLICTSESLNVKGIESVED